MTPADLADAVLAAVRAAVDSGDLDVAVPGDVKVERPKNREHGDYATSLPLQLAKPARRPPREVAETIAKPLRETPGVASVDIAGPGFLNITLEPGAQGELARTVVAADEDYGRTSTMAGQRINLEFVSANPTGPVHIGAVRWAAVGDALARVLTASGAEVTREYYFNDAGSQIDRFGRSLMAAAQDKPTPEDGYAGAYIDDIAKQIVASRPDIFDRGDEAAQQQFRAAGVDLMFAEIRDSLADFGVTFDVYFNEKELHEKGELDAALERLRSHGHVFEEDGAVWLRTTTFGDDRDRVLVRTGGEPTYFLADCAYYLDKRERGFDRCIYLLGADHHGYVGRLRAVAACFGDDPDRTLEVLIGQLVNLVRDGEPVRMSKRAGDYVALVDMVDAIGADAARYALARYSSDSPIDLDLDLWTRHTNDNPVYYVQYAHARVASLLRNASELAIPLGDPDAFRPELLGHDREGDLLGALGEFPRVVATAAELREPHRVARYLEELAGTYHRFYDVCRVLPRGDEETTDLHRARLWLVEATRVVLRNGLALLGVSAPERM
ncbi:MAG: arginyl-tRNA synthetase [Actinomycetota bacterium]|nr:arginyl-tRNA synthetase [Actinomycetota bacterium]